MSFTPDFELHDPSGRLIAIVEAKNKRHTNLEWAKNLHQTWMDEGLKDKPTFFVLVTPEHTYIWNHADNGGGNAQPSLILESDSLLGQYLKSASLESKKISGEAFEILVGNWLSEITAGNDRARDWTDFINLATHHHAPRVQA